MPCRLRAITMLLLVIGVPARAERLPIKTYTTADGLAHIRVTCLVSDSRGFLWVCGPNGLSRFDGQGFITYGIPEGLANLRINDFVESASGAYWVATNGGGVYRFNPLIRGPLTQGAERKPDDGTAAANRSRFTAFQVGDDLQTNRVNALLEDRAGRLWAGTDGGLFALDRTIEPPAFRRIILDLPVRPDRALQIWALTEDARGNLWIGTSWGLLRRLPDGRIAHWAFQPAQGADHVRALLIDRENRIWVGHNTGLFVYRLTPALAGASELYRASTQLAVLTNLTLPATPGHAPRYTTDDGVSGGMVRALLQSSDGHVWIGTWDGFTEFDGEHFHPFARAQGITKTMALAEDRQGNIWMGTAATGVLRLVRNGFRAYTEADGLADGAIGSVFESHTGDLHVVSNNQSVHRFDGTRFVAVRPNFSRDVVDPIGPGSALQDRTGEWWIPAAAGLYRFPKVDHVEDLGHISPKAIYTARNGLAGDDVFRLFEDSRGDVWIGRRLPTSATLTRWDRETGTFHKYSDADGLPAFNRIYAFAEDRAGNVWIGFQNGGLARYRNGRFTLFTAADGAPDGWISGLYIDARGRLWIGSTRPGLSRVDAPAAERPRFAPYTKAQGLSESVGCITEDRFGRLYFARPTGRIDRLDPATGRVRHYTTADGLTGNELTAAFRDRHGTLWFGSDNGLFRLVPGPDPPSSPPAVLIGSVRVAGERYLSSDLGERAIPEFQLEPTQKQLQIEFFGLGAGAADGLRYQYRLDGADKDWSAPTVRRDVNYSSLAPGSYRFLVRSVAADGALSSQPAMVEFTILPPIWQRWWFRSLGALGIILIVFGAHRYRVARLLALERVRMRIAADLHDDIGGSLSRISIQSEVACREAATGGDRPVRRLTEIAESAREMVDALGDVVWSVDPRRDDVASVLWRIREYADDLLCCRGLRWAYSAPPSLDRIRLDPEARRDLFLFLKEAITNVAKHAQARSAALRIELTRRELRAELIDDGRGVDQGTLAGEKASSRHGIASMKARADRLGGRFAIESFPGSGTKVSLRMPLQSPWRRMNMLLPTWLR